MKTGTGLLLGAAAAGLVIAGVLVDRALQPKAGTEAGASAGAAAGVSPAGSRRILYYRNAMGLPDTSPTPKKDSMGMDYVPVYADEQPSGHAVQIGTQKMQKLGVRTALVEARLLTRTLRVVGTVQIDERRQYAVSPKFEGWVTRLLVGTTGAAVRRGQPLLEVYSPDLVSAEQDYRVAAQALQALSGGDATARQAMQALMQGSVERLHNWDVADSELMLLKNPDAAPRNFVLRAQHDGVVTEKLARVGLRFMPGDVLYQVADLASVWLVGNVFEQDLAALRVGMPVTATVVSFPGKSFPGRISFIEPVLQADSRSAQVRIELPNAERLLKPAMYASVEIAAGPATPRLAVPNEAILDSGTRQLVLVDRGGGQFEPRAVRLGAQADGYTEILSGIAAHEAVVVNGNFLIDSESNLRAAVAGLSSPAGPVPPAAHSQH